MSVIHSNPTKTRQRIVELLRAQTEQGYGLHLFDPKAFDPDAEKLPDVPSPTIVPTPNVDDLIHGLEDTCSDDHLWLVPSVVEYVKETGDLAFLDLEIPFAQGTPATVYEHLRRALEFSAEQVGPNGVALGLRADWNDCLNLGGGETALVTFLHAWAIRAFLEVAGPFAREGREDARADVERWTAELERIRGVADGELWDGRWWIRGYTRDGVKIGSAANDEGKIFLEHQAWPVIAGITSQERGEASMDSVRELLGSEYGNHLNWPAFTKVDDTVGFVTRVYPGIKENAAIFSHPNAWPIIAEALLGRGDEAVQFYDAILPFNQNDNIEVRGAEPYAYVQFLYGRDHEWFGKAHRHRRLDVHRRDEVHPRGAARARRADRRPVDPAGLGRVRGAARVAGRGLRDRGAQPRPRLARGRVGDRRRRRERTRHPDPTRARRLDRERRRHAGLTGRPGARRRRCDQVLMPSSQPSSHPAWKSARPPMTASTKNRTKHAPTTIPAIAIPRPALPSRLIWLSATIPRISPTIPESPHVTRPPIDVHIDATASPLRRCGPGYPGA
jgi:hypothetical protein